MSITNKEISTTYKDWLIIDNSNAGFDTNIDQVKSGNGNGSSLYLSTNNLKVQPTADSTTNSVIYDKDGNILFQVDSTNDVVKALGNHVNTQYKEFGLFNHTPTQGRHEPLVANTFYASTSGTLWATGSPDFGTGTDPATSITAHAGVSAPLTGCIWYLMDAISIDSIRVLASSQSGSDASHTFHLMSYDIDTSSTYGSLSNGTLIANTASSMELQRLYTKTAALTIDSASVATNKVIVAFAENEDGTDKITCQLTVKYHLT